MLDDLNDPELWNFRRYQPKYDTFAHLVLSMEADLGTTDEDYITLDRLIDEAKDKINIKEDYSKDDAVAILKIIDTVLKENKFDIGKAAALFNTGLKSNKLISRHRSYIYSSIAEVCELPLESVIAPRNMFVRWLLADETHFNWNTKSADEQSDDHYKSWLNISQEAIDNGVYLKNLTKENFIGFVHSIIGQHLIINEQLEPAFHEFQEALRINPKDFKAYYGMGRYWIEEDHLYAAIEDLSKSIELDPNFVMPYYYRGWVFQKIGKLNPAHQDFDKVIELDPKFAQAYFYRGNVFERKIIEDDKAIEDYTKAIELDPKFWDAYRSRGNMFQRKKKHQDAIEDFTKAIELNPKEINAYYHRGKSLSKIGEHNKAIEDFNEVIRMNNDDSWAYHYRGNSYRKIGEHDRAMADYHKALSLEPEHCFARWQKGITRIINYDVPGGITDIGKGTAQMFINFKNIKHNYTESRKG